jgi:CBS domain-containing protein
MEKVADVLDRKYPQFNKVIPECLVSDALYQMACENADFLIVLQDGKFQGIITDHDIASRVLFDHRPLNKIQVREFMSRTLPVTTSDSPLEYCMQLMERYNVKHVAIFDRFDFRGVLSSQDILHESIQKHPSGFEETMSMQQGYPWRY